MREPIPSPAKWTDEQPPRLSHYFPYGKMYSGCGTHVRIYNHPYFRDDPPVNHCEECYAFWENERAEAQ